MRIGLLLLGHNVPAICFSVDVPEYVLEAWKIRKQYITQGELLAGPLALQCLEEVLAGQQVLWFVDNQAALTAMIKGASPVQDNCRMALILAKRLAGARVACWFEFVDSKANPSDPLSREGYEDPIVLSHLHASTWCRATSPREVDWLALLGTDNSFL